MIFKIILCVWLCVCVCLNFHAMVCMLKWEDILYGLIICNHVSSRYWTQFINLGGKNFYPLNHLLGPNVYFLDAMGFMSIQIIFLVFPCTILLNVMIAVSMIDNTVLLFAHYYHSSSLLCFLELFQGITFKMKSYQFHLLCFSYTRVCLVGKEHVLKKLPHS